MERVTVARARSTVKSKAHAILTKALHSITHQLVHSDKVAKAKKQPDQIVNSLDLSTLVGFAELTDDFQGAIEDASAEALSTVGLSDDEKITNLVNRRAVKAAEDQAAELVTNIDAATKNMLRSAIADGLERNIGLDQIAEGLSDQFAFSEDRADLIARTEISHSNSTGAMAGYRAAKSEAGVNLKKEWLLGPEPCEICVANNDQGPIDLDDDFDSGDDAPPAHPNCECAISPVVEDE